MYTNRSLAALLLCLPAAENFYIVVSQDVVTVGVVTVVLEMHACVGRDQHLCCLLFPLRHQHVCAFIIFYYSSLIVLIAIAVLNSYRSIMAVFFPVELYHRRPPILVCAAAPSS